MAHLTLDSGPLFHCNQAALMWAKRTSANILVFSDGGYGAASKKTVGAWLAYAIHGPDRELLAVQGIVVNNLVGSFAAEVVAQETYVAFIKAWLGYD